VHLYQPVFAGDRDSRQVSDRLNIMGIYAGIVHEAANGGSVPVSVGNLFADTSVKSCAQNKVLLCGCVQDESL
jgi:hypothetical protein